MPQTEARKAKPSDRRRGDGRAAFLAQIDAIRQHVAAGYTLRRYYEAHEKALGFGYKQFAKYVDRYIKAPKPTHTSPAVEHQKENAHEHNGSGTQSRTGKLPGFQHSATPAKDLI
jgi:hypothetical protein